MTIREKLDENIPREVISTRNQSGKTLSYLESWYVIDRLNQVLGTENWSWIVQKLDPIPGDKLGFICHGVIQAIVDGKQVMKTGLGYGSDKGSFNPGEMASKEAESDALKRAAMKFGRSLGLALYDKTQEYVDEVTVSSKPVPSTKNEKPTTPPITKTVTPTSTGPSVQPVEAGGGNLPSESAKPFTDTKILRAKIKSAFSVLEAQKKVSKTEFVTNYLAGGRVDTISNDQVNKTLGLLKTKFPELGIS
jgi:Rad52/22 family double-strand break repair protein